MIRQQTGESRSQRVALTDDDGLPLTGLTPTAKAWRASDGAALTDPAVQEIAGGFYRVLTGALTADAVVRVDRGTSGPGRYVFLEVVVGGYVDNLDATISSRATSAALTALTTAVGTPAQASALAALTTAVGSPAQSAALTALASTLGSPAQAAELSLAFSTLLADVDARAVEILAAIDSIDVSATSAPDVEVGP